MAGSGEILTYGELERRSNKLAHLLRANAMQRLDHFAIFMETTSATSNAAPPVSALGSITLHQFLPDAGRARLHRQQQRIQDSDHVNGKARGCTGGATAMPQDPAMPHR